MPPLPQLAAPPPRAALHWHHLLQMSDRITKQQAALAMLSAAAASAALSWALLASKRPRDNEEPTTLIWKQVPPEDSSSVQGKLISQRLPVSAMRRRARADFELMNARRTVRFYSKDDIPQDVLEYCLNTAGTSPSGAHHQPWFFAAVRSQEIKQKIRELVEAEEKVNYERRMRSSWVQDLSTMTGEKSDARLKDETGAPKKQYLTDAPVIIAMFKQTHGVGPDGARQDNYYVNESCGLAAGFLLAALHRVGLATLTSTPMGAEQGIRSLLGRSENEKLFLLLPVGYPAADATVPFRTPLRKPREQLFATY